jgi:hypothetical protein
MALITAVGVGTFYLEEKASAASSSGVLTLDLNVANIFTVSLTENISNIIINNIAASGIVTNFTLILTYTSTPVSITWPLTFDWPAGAPPTLTNVNGKKDIFSFVTEDGGSNWYAFNGGQNI